MTEQERIKRARAKRERRAKRVYDTGHDPRSYAERERRRLQGIAIRMLFGLDRHTATWEREHGECHNPGDWGSTWDYECEDATVKEMGEWLELVERLHGPTNVGILADHGVVQFV